MDATVGVVTGENGLLVVDTGGSLEEGAELAASLTGATGRAATDVVITHAHWDHCFGTLAFAGAEVFGAQGLAARLDGEELARDAVRYGAEPARAREAAAALVAPSRLVDGEYELDLGGRVVRLLHPGGAHTDHDLAVVVPVPGERTIVFCGDLVEESGPPQAGPDAVPEGWPAALDRLLAAGGDGALYVPGHGAVVDAGFVRDQRNALAARFGVS
ncbi:MBL fold hydrolase [Wenjunlia tyrosinilytica]|uniref:MBL fold hydrolase n=1 Tax=Wenjunlia tyrosinilytica TaxID=1544741 RepID=A0A917ZCH2_9ACTN|nr:MBL fold hydrolase [Wenjunlia tyrosinilytica]